MAKLAIYFFHPEKGFFYLFCFYFPCDNRGCLCWCCFFPSLCHLRSYRPMPRKIDSGLILSAPLKSSFFSRAVSECEIVSRDITTVLTAGRGLEPDFFLSRTFSYLFFFFLSTQSPRHKHQRETMIFLNASLCFYFLLTLPFFS